MTDQHQQEQRTESAIKVRQVTEVHSNWNEDQRGEEGKFSFQLILDNGAEEYVIRPTNEDADVLVDLFEQTDTVYFDMERRVLRSEERRVGKECRSRWS